MNTLNRQNPLLWLGLLLLAWLVLGVQLAAPKVASGPFYAATEHHLGVTRWEAAPRLGLDAWTTKSASGDTVGAKATASLEKEAGTYFGQQRKYWSQEPIQYNGNKVYQRNDLIDPGRVDSQTGLTNKQLMENGLAPYGTDGKKINLHHMLQTQDGPIAEVTQSFHQKNTAVIHINSGSDIPSGINRAQFEKWKKDYWKTRASDF